jgi:flavin reductase (DIM6/NTAB) family NADH-FMN oxidoreductase RutF
MTSLLHIPIAKEHTMPADSADSPNADNSALFRAVMSRFATGVTVATTCQGSRRLGITVNAFASVSLEPPLVLVCIDRTSRVHDAFIESGIFAVNFLTSDQEELSRCFAGDTDCRHNEFCGVASHVEATGAPVFDEALAFVDCRIDQVYDGGDHDILLGRVQALGTGARGAEPLLYYRSEYIHPEDEQPL